MGRVLRGIVVLASLGLAWACGGQQQPAATEPEAEPQYEDTRVPELEAKLNQRVTLEGLAIDMKLGAGLMVDDHIVHMDGLHRWPDGFYEGEGEERRVEVTGTLIVRHDLPVFVMKEGEPVMQGIPVPPGTDLHEASRRYLLTDFSYEPIP